MTKIFAVAWLLLLFPCLAKIIPPRFNAKSWRDGQYQRDGKLEEETEGNRAEGVEEESAYKEMASYLKRFSHKTDFQKYSKEEIENALRSLATAQSTWKSMDGITHRFKNTFKKSSSLQSRYDNFISKKSKNTKEAAKLREYITTVERGLQACEILQSVSIKDVIQRKDSLAAINLTEIHHFRIHYNKVHCIVSFLAPTSLDAADENLPILPPELQPFAPDELIITIVDDVKKESIGIAQLLRLMTFEQPIPITIPDRQEAFYIQPTLLELSLQACEKLLSILSSIQANLPQAGGGNQTKEDAAVTLINELDEITNQSTAKLTKLPKRFRVLGYSAGGGVATYLSMILDGALNIRSYFQDHPSQNISNETISTNSSTTTTNTSNATTSDISRLFGRYKNRVRAMAIGPPPCINRNIVPKFLSCIVHGDDVISRIQNNSIHQFQKRMITALQSGAGTASSWGWMLNTGLLQDVKTVAGKSLSRYKGSKKDPNTINLPGRVFFIKSRQYKKGATVQRVLRGNWQEDILWNLHDILISKRMFDHHSLDAYLRTLARC